MLVLTLFVVIAAGVLMGFQSPTNTELSRHIGNFQATTVSFFGGMMILALAVALFGSGDLTQIVNVPWWQLIGGIYGVCVVLVITFAAPVLGIALTLTFLMFGQIVVGMVIDQFGLMLITAAPLNSVRIIGCIAVGIGILFVYFGKKGGSAGSGSSSKRLIMGILAFLGGVAGGIQAPTNTALAASVGKIEASFVSFVGGFLTILIVTLILQKGKLNPMRGQGIKPWMVIGGFYGSIAVFTTILATPVLGVALMMACTMLGQLGGGILIDSFGLLRSEKVVMNKWRYIGVIAIGIGIVLVAYAKVL